MKYHVCVILSCRHDLPLTAVAANPRVVYTSKYINHIPLPFYFPFSLLSLFLRFISVSGRDGVQRHPCDPPGALGVLHVVVRRVQCHGRGLLHRLHPQPLLHLHVQVGETVCKIC